MMIRTTGHGVDSSDGLRPRFRPRFREILASALSFGLSLAIQQAYGTG